MFNITTTLRPGWRELSRLHPSHARPGHIGLGYTGLYPHDLGYLCVLYEQRGEWLSAGRSRYMASICTGTCSASPCSRTESVQQSVSCEGKS